MDSHSITRHLATWLCLATLFACDGHIPAAWGQSQTTSSAEPEREDLFDTLVTEVEKSPESRQNHVREPDPEDRLSFHDVYDEQIHETYFDEGISCGNGITCGSGCIGCGGCRPSRGWFNAGYLLWWAKSSDLPVLATASSDPNGSGALGDTNTGIVFGGTSINGEARGGGKFDFGMWLDSGHTSAWQLTYYFLGEKEESFFGSQEDYPLLARPFFNVEAASEDARIIADPDEFDGSMNLRAVTELHTSALAYRQLVSRRPGGRVDCLMGYRFAYLGESVNIVHSSTDLSSADAGTVIDLADSFDTRNTFHGAEIGFELQQQMDRIWNCVCIAKIALGGSHSETQIVGQTTTDDGATSTTTSSGLLVQDSNRGIFRDTEFNTVSEFGISLNRRVTDNFSFTFAYNILLWSHVMRAAEQIDRNINPTQIPPGTLSGPALPAFPNNSTSYWAHGINFNLEGRF